MHYSIEETTLPAGPAAAIRQKVAMRDLPTFFSGAFHELADVIARAGRHPTAAPFARYHSFSPDVIDVEAVMPVEAPVPAVGRVHPLAMEAGPAIQVRHVGRYDAIGPAYQAIGSWLTEHHRAARDAPREVYLTDPAVVPDQSQHVTLIVQPIAP